MSASKFKILNPETIDNEDLTYRYNMLIQFELSSMNGLSAINNGSKDTEQCAVLNEDNSIIIRNRLTIACAFITLKHFYPLTE